MNHQEHANSVALIFVEDESIFKLLSLASARRDGLNVYRLLPGGSNSDLASQVQGIIYEVDPRANLMVVIVSEQEIRFPDLVVATRQEQRASGYTVTMMYGYNLESLASRQGYDFYLSNAADQLHHTPTKRLLESLVSLPAQEGLLDAWTETYSQLVRNDYDQRLSRELLQVQADTRMSRADKERRISELNLGTGNLRYIKKLS